MKNLFKDLSTQDYITLGYLYLVVLGVINIVIYYSAFDINIFDYIAITDILLAPINMLFLDYLNTVKIILYIGFFCYLLKFLFIGINKLIETISIKFNKPLLLKTVVYQPFIAFIILFSYIFLDMSVSMTEYVSLKIKSKAHKSNTTITFADNTQRNVSVIATTSVYLFYVEKGEDIVIITPISGNVKSIKRTR